MCARVSWYVAVFMVLISADEARPGDTAAIDQIWMAKLRTEGKAIYEKYKALAPHLEEESEFFNKKAPGPARAIRVRLGTFRRRIVRLDDNMLYEERHIEDGTPNSSQIRLRCENNDYYFTLTRTKEDAPYALVNYTPGKQKISLVKQALGLHNEVYGHLYAALAAIENENNFFLKALRFDGTNGLVRMEYAFSKGDNRFEDQISIDPNHGWRVLERRMESPYAVVTERWSYSITLDGLEFPTEFKNLSTYKVSKAPPNLEITGRLISLKLTDKTPADFRLSAFDLPEPVDVAPPPKPTRWYLWLLLSAGLCAALSFGFAYLYRRRARRTSPLAPGASS